MLAKKKTLISSKYLQNVRITLVQNHGYRQIKANEAYYTATIKVHKKNEGN